MSSDYVENPPVSAEPNDHAPNATKDVRENPDEERCFDDEEQATEGGPPGWLAFGIVGITLIGAMTLIVLVALLSAFGRW